MGFWGTPSFDSCEDKYAVTDYVAEFWNTLSCLLGIALGVYSYLSCPTNEWHLRWTSLLAILGSVSSALAHATMNPKAKFFALESWSIAGTQDHAMLLVLASLMYTYAVSKFRAIGAYWHYPYASWQVLYILLLVLQNYEDNLGPLLGQVLSVSNTVFMKTGILLYHCMDSLTMAVFLHERLRRLWWMVMAVIFLRLAAVVVNDGPLCSHYFGDDNAVATWLLGLPIKPHALNHVLNAIWIHYAICLFRVWYYLGKDPQSSLPVVRFWKGVVPSVKLESTGYEPSSGTKQAVHL